MVWRTSGTIVVVSKMHFLLPKTPSDVPTTWCWRYDLTSCLSVSSPFQVSLLSSLADSLSHATTMNSLLQSIILVCNTLVNWTAWSSATELYWSSQLCMQRWQDHIATDDRPHNAYAFHCSNARQEGRKSVQAPTTNLPNCWFVVSLLQFVLNIVSSGISNE